MPFSGKVALVTGGTRGIGKAVADKLEAGGAHVVRWGLKSGITVDVRNEIEVQCYVEQIMTNAGRIDILVNNAGVFGPNKNLLQYTLTEFESVMLSNLTSQFIVCKAVIPHMVGRGYGRVVNMSSVVGRDANPLAPVYSTSKAGVIRMTQALARSLSTTGVLVNCVAPSACLTDLFRNTPQEHLDAMKAKVPMGRFATVDEIAALVCWLASDEMTYSTGAVFDCSGGRHD